MYLNASVLGARDSAVKKKKKKQQKTDKKCLPSQSLHCGGRNRKSVK